MMSLRSLARAVPRSASRLTQTSSSTISRPFLQTVLRTHIPRIAAFSTSHILRDEHSQHLAAKLASEIAIETDEVSQQAESDSNVEAFRAENPAWEILDTEGEQDVFLTRKFDDETITVHFSIADFNAPGEEAYDEMDPAMGDEEDMDVQSGGANTKGSINRGGTANANFKIAPEDSIAPADREELRDEEDDSPSFPVNVQVLIQRPNKGALKFALTAAEGDFEIHQLVQLPQNLKSSTDAKELLRDNSENIYFGPPFAQLDDEVQGLLESYLNARGVTSYLATFIPDYIDVKEQKEYLNWLGRVKEFVDN